MVPNIAGNRAFICAGEPSGDEFARLIVRAYKAQRPELAFFGIAGDAAARAGMDVIMRYDEMMVFGMQSSVESIQRSLMAYRTIARLLYRERPDAFIGIAYPGVNLLLCRYARKLGCETYLFFPPQIWAWGGFRKYFIRKWVDRAVSVFPFEYEYYHRRKLPVVYLRHPQLESLSVYRREDRQRRVGFMPGSRPEQIKRHMPVIERLIGMTRERYPGYECCIILHPAVNSNISASAGRIIKENRYQAMKDCDLIVTTSGTASLESAFLGVPQVFFHIPAFLDMHLFRHFIHIREYNLANLYHDRKIVPCVVGRDCRRIHRKIMDFIEKLLANNN